jgi:hypothetical protein
MRLSIEWDRREWTLLRSPHPEIETQDLVVVPSMSFSVKDLTTIIDGFIHYEERSLYVLFALSNPGTRLIIVTSTTLDALNTSVEWITERSFV